VLWRRSKLGLHLSPAERDAVAAWCEAHWGPATMAPSAAQAATSTAKEASWS
jgi:glycerol-3-phosphate dehydrogenase